MMNNIKSSISGIITSTCVIFTCVVFALYIIGVILNGGDFASVAAANFNTLLLIFVASLVQACSISVFKSKRLSGFARYTIHFVATMVTVLLIVFSAENSLKPQTAVILLFVCAILYVLAAVVLHTIKKAMKK
jgi:hypothetical protein